MVSTQPDEHFSPKQLATFMGVPIGTVYSMVCKRQIPHLRLSKRLVRFSRAEIEKWMRERRVSIQATEARGG